MTCVLLQFDTPSDPGKLEEYNHWVTQTAVPSIIKAPGVTEMRAYRNMGGGSPQVTVMIEFASSNQAIAFMGTGTWNSIVATCRSLGVGTLSMSLLVPSPLLSGPLKP